MEKYCRVLQATDDSMAHAHCMLDREVYKQTLRICNIYCFSAFIRFLRKNGNTLKQCMS